MPTLEKVDISVLKMADSLIKEFYPPESMLAKIRIDYLWSFAEKDDETGKPIGDALTLRGLKVGGICRVVPYKQRVKGGGDAEITLDGDAWMEMDEAEQRALLDHELYHIVVTSKIDALDRPKVRMRKHDAEFGWFYAIAQRHGLASGERKQAKSLMEAGGQYLWPEIANASTNSHRAGIEQAARLVRAL